MKIKDIKNIVIDKIVDNNIGEYVETTGFERTDVPSNSKYSEILINFDPEKGIKIPLMTPDSRVYFQLISKDMLIEMLKAYLPEINSNLTHHVMGKKAKVVLKRKRKTHK